MLINESQYLQDKQHKDNSTKTQDDFNLEIYNQIKDTGATGFVTKQTFDDAVSNLQVTDQNLATSINTKLNKDVIPIPSVENENNLLIVNNIGKYQLTNLTVLNCGTSTINI